MSTVTVLTKILDKQVPLLITGCCHWLKKSENVSFESSLVFSSLHLVSRVKHLVHGDANIRRDKMVFQDNSLRFSGLILIIYMKKKKNYYGCL